MTPRLKIASFAFLFAFMFSFLPAAHLANPAHAQSVCDWAQFVADVTVPDGMSFASSAAFKKTWRLKNIGSCTWSTSYALVFDSGEKMGGPTAVTFPNQVAPGQTLDISVDLTAPGTAGHYIGYWKFRNSSGTLFGIGSTTNKSFWVEINVTGSTTNDVAYDFTANAGSASWSSGAGALSFPGTDGDSKGFALKKDNPKFESGVVAAKPGLLFAPQNISNGYVQGKFSSFKAQSGDRFQSTIGCESGATACYVAYRLDYEVGGAAKTFWTFREKYEGLTFNVGECPRRVIKPRDCLPAEVNPRSTLP